MISRDKWRGLFVGAAVGDALGGAVEKMTRQQILAATRNQGVTGYLPGLQAEARDTGATEPGETSDDTQLALWVTASSLLGRGEFDIADQARLLVETYRRKRKGWGRTTLRAATELEEWFKSSGAAGRDPHMPVPLPEEPRASAGSGPAMKVYPLAAYCYLGETRRDFVTPAIQLGRLTHGNPSAVIASVAVGEAIDVFAHATQQSLFDQLFHSMLRRVHEAESDYPGDGASVFHERSSRAWLLREDPAALREEINRSFLARDSVSFALVTAWRHVGDYRGAVLEAVNAGQDADTTASIVGALLGVQVGLSGIPPEWIRDLRGVERILAMADAMYLWCCHGFTLGDLSRIVNSNLLNPY